MPSRNTMTGLIPLVLLCLLNYLVLKHLMARRRLLTQTLTGELRVSTIQIIPRISAMINNNSKSQILNYSLDVFESAWQAFNKWSCDTCQRQKMKQASKQVWMWMKRFSGVSITRCQSFIIIYTWGACYQHESMTNLWRLMGHGPYAACFVGKDREKC